MGDSAREAPRERIVRDCIVTALIAGGLALAASDAVAGARKASPAPRAKPDSIDISYVEPKLPSNQAVYRLLKERQALEKLRDLLKPLRLPHRLLLRTQD